MSQIAIFAMTSFVGKCQSTNVTFTFFSESSHRFEDVIKILTFKTSLSSISQWRHCMPVHDKFQNLQAHFFHFVPKEQPVFTKVACMHMDIHTNRNWQDHGYRQILADFTKTNDNFNVNNKRSYRKSVKHFFHLPNDICTFEASLNCILFVKS